MSHHAFIKQWLARTRLLEVSEPGEGVVIEVVELLVYSPRDVALLQYLRHGCPVEARPRLIVLKNKELTIPYRQATGTREEMQSIGVGACEGGLVILVSAHELIV